MSLAEGTRASSTAMAELLRDASIRIDDVVSQLKKAGVAVDNLGSLRALDDNNSSCNTACTCGGGGGGGGGGGNCVALS